MSHDGGPGLFSSRRLEGLALVAAGLVIGSLSTASGLYLAGVSRLEDLEPWHRVIPQAEVRASEGPLTFESLLTAEARLFDDPEGSWRRRVSTDAPLNRYNPASPTHPENLPRNWNRSYRLTPPHPLGTALLLHGLSDSPYSLRALGDSLLRSGFDVVGLRLPGHGTVPAALRTVRWRDWRAAVRAAALAAGEGSSTERPFVIVGYSNGAALALDYALAAIDDPDLPRPAHLVFLSPALAITPLAAMARVQDLLSNLPLLGKLAWQEVLPEYDPFKYNSFPMNAAEQIYLLTGALERQLSHIERQGRIGELPPVLVLQSVVDATVAPLPSLSRLFLRLEDGRSELVLFDVNRMARAMRLLTADVDALLRATSEGETLPFRVTLVTNADESSLEVVARTRAPGSPLASEEPLRASWPPGVYSLSHVALPFPPDDPIYGTGGEGPRPYPFGSLELRGERGTLRIPADLLLRLRFNPFFPYLERRILDFVGVSEPPSADESGMRGVSATRGD